MSSIGIQCWDSVVAKRPSTQRIQPFSNSSVQVQPQDLQFQHDCRQGYNHFIIAIVLVGYYTVLLVGWKKHGIPKEVMKVSIEDKVQPRVS